METQVSSGSWKLANVVVDQGNPVYEIIDNVIFDKRTNELILYPKKEIHVKYLTE